MGKFKREEDGTCTFTLTYRDREFVGVAHCHPDDSKFFSEITGGTIAEVRAQIKMLKYKRDCELRPQYAIVKHLYQNLEQGTKKFDKKDRATALIIRHFNRLKREINQVDEEIIDCQNFLKSYIRKKETILGKLR